MWFEPTKGLLIGDLYIQLFRILLMDYVILCGSNRRTKQKLQQKTKEDEQQGPYKTRGSQEPVIAHLVFNLTSRVDRKWGCYT
jgi:hypothetical protein